LEGLEDRNLLSTYMVDHLADDTVGSGLNGSLRYCITNAVDNDTITFSVTGTINLTGALPNLTNSVTIQGPGANSLTVRRDTGGYYRIFTVGSAASVSISGLTMADGGGGLLNNGTLTISNCVVSGNYALQQGGGIANNGNLVVSNSLFSGNTSEYYDGGAIFNHGTLTVSYSSFSSNNAYYGSGGAIANDGASASVNTSALFGNYQSSIAGGGGGIFNYAGALTVTNCTITGNSTFDLDGSVGGGIEVYGGTLSVSNSTIAGNNADAGGGIGTPFGGTIQTRNSIIAANTAFSAPDVYGTLASLGYNLIGNTQGGTGFDPTDLLNVNPLLGPLQDNGGPTKTMALLAGSPALNAGNPAQLGVADQRGVVRTGGVNIGAYQASASVLTLTGLPTSAVAGTAVNATLTAKDIYGQTALGYTGTVHFSSTDGQATLPGDYPFTLGDGGVHVFSSGITLKTAGPQTVAATDTVTGSISGSATVTVNPAAADHLLFLQQPTNTAAGQTISPVIAEVVDAFGNVETSDNSDTITLSLGTNPSGGTLSGTLTLTVVNGVATFSDLAIDLAGSGYTLHATVGGGLPDSDSNPFNITV
jgi:hypothetical protein